MFLVLHDEHNLTACHISHHHHKSSTLKKIIINSALIYWKEEGQKIWDRTRLFLIKPGLRLFEVCSIL